MAEALDVARYILQLAEFEAEPEPITHLRLQKLLYYVQGWHLGLEGSPLFEDDFQAWAHGPVLPSLYQRFSSYGATPILASDSEPGNPLNLSDEEREFIEEVWEAYKGYSAAALRHKTHNESPWQNAHKGYGPADRCEEIISKEDMRDHFSKAASES